MEYIVIINITYCTLYNVMGETTKSTSHICQQAEGLCVTKTMFSCTGRLHMDSEVLLRETHL
jgi:hypothetical protein